MNINIKKVQISNGIFLAFMINLVYTKGIGLTQGILARQVGNDMWIATTFGIIKGVIIMTLTVWLIRRMPEKNIIEHAEVLFGKWISKLISLIVFLFFVGAYASIIITYVYHIRDYFAPDAPILLPIVIAMIVALYAIYKGFEVIGRFAMIGVFSILIFNILMVFGSFGQFDIKEMLPVFSSGFMDNLESSIHYDTEWAMTTMMAAMILPMVKEKKTWGKAGTAGIVYGGLIVLLWPILESGSLSPEVTSQYIVACMQMARGAEIGLFLHRYEMIMVALFAVALYTQIMLFTYLGSLTIAHTFNLKDIRQAFIPVILILNGFGYWVVFSHVRAMNLLTYVWPQIGVTIAVGLPFILFVTGFFFKDKISRYRQVE